MAKAKAKKRCPPCTVKVCARLAHMRAGRSKKFVERAEAERRRLFPAGEQMPLFGAKGRCTKKSKTGRCLRRAKSKSRCKPCSQSRCDAILVNAGRRAYRKIKFEA